MCCSDRPHCCLSRTSGGNARRHVFDDEAPLEIDHPESGRQRVALRIRPAVADRLGVDNQQRLWETKARKSDPNAVRTWR
jgi:hypothetical protein